jgi:hypothetical protein
MEAMFIPDQPPEPAQDPRWLKDQGILALQARVGEVWTHYNDVDPGVTLLEHLCWGLSEVGYCADFPIEDLLAGPGDRIAVPDQFPAQAAMLSHQPLTDEDLGKWLFDRLPDLRALQLVHERDAGGLPTGRIGCHLAARPGLDADAREALRRQVRHHLRQWRLPGQDVLPPAWMSMRTLGLAARIQVVDAHQAASIATVCRQRLDHYIAPRPRQDGYRHWRDQGHDGARIIEGPNLSQGWMVEGLPWPPQSVRLGELAALLADIEGVELLQRLCLTDGAHALPQVMLARGELVEWALDLEFWHREQCCLRLQGTSTDAGVVAMQAKHARMGIEAGIDLQAPMPQGRDRRLADYIPVQSTLPPNWGLGGDNVHQSPQQIALKRQLRGYLLPFEQLLANQFAQLSQLGRLFSPSNQVPIEQGERPEDLPWRPLARTSFSQPLDRVDDIEALLGGHNPFDVWLGKPNPRQAARMARRFSHGVYRQALSLLCESEHDALQRRLAMLRHLLARHGEDASDYDAMVLACQWYGSRERTLVVVYGLWLQNIVFLSHARCCAARYPAPPLRLPGDPDLPERCPALTARLSAEAGGAPWWARLQPWPEADGQIDVARLEAMAALDETALEGFGSFECKAALLLDLPVRLSLLAAKLLQALSAPGIRTWLRESPAPGARFVVPDSDLYLFAHRDGLRLCEGGWRPGEEAQQALLEIEAPVPGARSGWPARWRVDVVADHAADAMPAPLTVADPDEALFLHCHAHALQLLWLATQRKGFLLLEPVLLAGDALPAADAVLSAVLVWPRWVCALGGRMAGFVDTLRQRHWPAHVALEGIGAGFAQLADVIPPFVQWHNGHGRESADPQATRRLAQSVATLRASARKREGSA